MADPPSSPSQIPTTLKRKRGPSHSNGVSGDQGSLQPIEQQTTDELVQQEIEEARLQSKSPEEWGLISDDEAGELVKRLYEIGAEAFMREIELKQLDMRAVGTAMGIDPDYEGMTDENYYDVLRGVLPYILNKRRKLLQYNTIEDAAKLLGESKKILVITGAGISTSLGIPDFRSKDTGFYAKLAAMGMSDPAEVFDIDAFDYDPSTFYNLAGDILPNMNVFSPTHAFIRLLQDKGRLLTNYTQNIDALEGVAGITPDRLLQCHGSFATASCRNKSCNHQVPGEDIFDDIRAKRIAYCKKCIRTIAAAKTEQAQAPKKKKKSKHAPTFSSDDEASDDDIPTPGVMKPDITFFGEKLPDTFFSRFDSGLHGPESADRMTTDLVLVIGTSMKVGPVALMPDKIAASGRNSVPVVYIGREACRHIEFDVQLLGDCDAVVWELARRTGWRLEHEMIPDGFGVEVREVEEGEGSWWEVVKK